MNMLTLSLSTSKINFFLFSLNKFGTCDSIKRETADWFPHRDILLKRKQIASMLATMSGARRGQTRLPVLSIEVPLAQTLRVMKDNTKAIRRILATIDSKMQGAMDWTQDPVLGGVGEESVRIIIQMTLRVAERSLPRESKRLINISDEMSHILRNDLRSNQIVGGRHIGEKLAKVIPLVLKTLKEVEKAISQEERNQLRQSNKRKNNEDLPGHRKKPKRD